MLFNSIDFAVFIPIVFLLYWFVFNKNIKAQNVFVVIASYVFYSFWDWRFLSLILVSTLIDYLVGLSLKNQDKPLIRKLLLFISIVVNLGLLGFFKYYNFFIENFITAFSFFGKDLSIGSLSIVLPIGISFYTFQTMSYTIDVYRRQIKPTTDFIAFASFVAFFPQMIAGPIERAKNLLPQFIKIRRFEYDKAIDGLRQILWGLFKKMVIADNCAVFVDEFFKNQDLYNGSTLLIGAFLFTIQIYCDFSGYSDIAIGTSRLFGFDLKQNFAFPYFSRDIAEFWRRWHISLSTWFRDYVYIPLGGSRGNTFQKVRNTFAIFIISGFWHGANWTFIIWGFLNVLYFLPLILRNKNRVYTGNIAEGRLFPNIIELRGMIMTFFLTLIAWVFFRAENINQALSYLSEIFSTSLFSLPTFANRMEVVIVFILVLVFFIIEWMGRNHQYAIEKWPLEFRRSYRWMFYYAIVFMVFYFAGQPQQFIYFQF